MSADVTDTAELTAAGTGDPRADLPSLLFTDTEEELRAAVREALADTAPWTDVLAWIDRNEPYPQGPWQALAGTIGCAGLLVPEELGGAGADASLMAVVAQELGRSVAPTPFLGSAVLATVALLGCRAPHGPNDHPQDHSDVDSLLRSLAAAQRTATLAVPLSTDPGAAVEPSARAIGHRLNGRVRAVADVEGSAVVLVPANTDGGIALYALETADIAVRERVVSLDQTRILHDLEFTDTPGTPVARGETARRAIRQALRYGAVMLAAELLGVAERSLETTVEYARTRVQFGRPIGSNQSVRHRLADVWVEVTQARAASRYAAARLSARGRDAQAQTEDEIALAVAKAHCSEIAVHAAEEQVQLHGGIGFTWEHPAHLYLKRAKSSAIALGTADRHRARLAELLDLPS